MDEILLSLILGAVTILAACAQPQTAHEFRQLAGTQVTKQSFEVSALGEHSAKCFNIEKNRFP